MRGFTLIETIIYITITSLILTALITVAYQMIDDGNRIEQKVLVLEEADFLIHKIDWILNDSVENVSKLETVDGNLLWKENGKNLILNSSAVTVSNLQFQREVNYLETSFKVDDQLFKTTNYLP